MWEIGLFWRAAKIVSTIGKHDRFANDCASLCRIFPKRALEKQVSTKLVKFGFSTYRSTKTRNFGVEI